MSENLLNSNIDDVIEFFDDTSRLGKYHELYNGPVDIFDRYSVREWALTSFSQLENPSKKTNNTQKAYFCVIEKITPTQIARAWNIYICKFISWGDDPSSDIMFEP